MSAAAIKTQRVCVCVFQLCVCVCLCERNVQMFGCRSVCLFVVSFLVNDSVLFIRHFNTFDADARASSGTASAAATATATQRH